MAKFEAVPEALLRAFQKNVVNVNSRAGRQVADKSKGGARRSDASTADINAVEIEIVRATRGLKDSRR